MGFLFFPYLNAKPGLDDENSPASKLSKEWCFILGLALGCACVVFLFPKAPHYTVPSMNYGGAGKKKKDR